MPAKSPRGLVRQKARTSRRQHATIMAQCPATQHDYLGHRLSQMENGASVLFKDNGNKFAIIFSQSARVFAGKMLDQKAKLSFKE